MNLAARRSERQRESLVMRFGCILVSAAMLVSFVVEAPKAEAFAVTTGTVYALVGAFLAACGLVPVVTGMADTDEVGEAIAQVVQDYLTTEVGGQSVLEWAGDIAKVGASPTGSLILPRMMAEKFAQFASWVASKFVAKPGEAVTPGAYPVLNNESSILLADGSKFMLTDWNGGSDSDPSVLGTVCRWGDEFIFATGSSLTFVPSTSKEDIYVLAFFDPNGSMIGHENFDFSDGFGFIYYDYYESHYDVGYYDRVAGRHYYYNCFSRDLTSYLTFSPETSLDLEATESYQQILDRLSALEEGQSVALDVGATQSMETQEILQSVLDAILAGNLAASAEVVEETVVPVDPPAETLPDVDGLGLPALGAALTSRFPFSIPWDVYKGVQLLAAPAEAPYFEVDFMEPIAYRVGGWKGSTKIVLDFSEYEIIGQVCRWTSTVGFCLMLAAATKRLIWTA